MRQLRIGQSRAQLVRGFKGASDDEEWGVSPDDGYVVKLSVEEMEKLYVTEDTHWWPWLLPAQKLEMGWCIACHRENGATQDCYACHY